MYNHQTSLLANMGYTLLRNVIYLFLILSVLFLSRGLTQSKNLSENDKVMERILALDAIKTRNFEKFNSELSVLKKQKKDFSIIQICYIDFLDAYKIAYSGEFKESLRQLKLIFSQCKDLNIRYRVKALMANLAVISGDYLDAVSNIDYSLNQVEEIDDKATKHSILVVASTVYNLVSQDKLSLKFSEMVIQDNPSETNLCKARVHKYRILLRQKGKQNQRKKILTTISECRDHDEMLYAQLLNVNWLKHQYKKASRVDEFELILNRLLDVESEIEHVKYENLIGIKNSLMAQLYEKMDKLDLAIKYAQLTIDGSISIGQTAQKIKALQVMINYYQSHENYKKANEYLLKKNQSEKKYYSDEQAKLMAFQTVKHDSLANSYKIKALSQENDLLQLKNQLAEKSKKNQLLINLLFVIVVVSFVFFAYRMIRQQRKFKKLSEYDDMTMIYNRKGIKDYMEYLLPYATKKNEIVAYVIFDLDLFKRVNDVYGHVVGDWVIKQSIKVCKELNNEKAVFARLGGEEFSIVIRDSSIDEAVEFSDQCRKAIAAINTLDGSNYDFEISASFGLTTSEISGYDYTKLMTHADNALYYSKENGRNRLTIYHQYETKQ